MKIKYRIQFLISESKEVDLFGNEDEDDLFGDKPAEVKKETPKKKVRMN